MRKGFWLWQPDLQKKFNTLVLALFVLSTVVQTTVGFAAPGYFARPGAGVSRLPLDVLAFGAPGFGEVEDAINLATGNVYIAADATSNNNLSGAGDDTTNRIGNGTWTYAPRLQLVGFVNTPAWTSANAPSSFFLGRGDGSGDNFFRFTPTDYTQVPSWVQRYQAHVSAGKAVLYALQGRNGLQYSQEWIVLVLTPQDGNIAHYYQQDGSRYSFFKKGQWPDFMQTPYEQYKASTGSSAAPDGIFNGAPTGNRTNFTYTNPTSGFIKQVDNLTFGRTTEYIWDTPNKKLNSIRYLLKTKTDNNSWARKVDFTYVTYGTNHYVKTVMFTAPNGRGANVSRTVTFDYSPTQVPGKVVVTYIGREVLQGISASKKEEYFYKYDTSGRVTQWYNNQDLGANIEYQSISTVTNDIKVIVTQGKMDVVGNIWTLVPSVNNKVEEYYFNSSSQLYKKRIKNRNGWVTPNNWLWPADPPPGWNPNDPWPPAGFNPDTDIWLEWNYTYYGSGSSAPGSTATIINPGGQKTEYFYDERANLSQVNTWWTDEFGSYIYRTKFFKYNNDNRLIADIDWGDSTSFDDISYDYSTTKMTHEVTTWHQSTSSTRGMTTLPITIKVPSVIKHHQKLGGSNNDIDGTSMWYSEDSFDVQGRITQNLRVANGTDTVTTTYSYTPSSTLRTPLIPDGLGSATPSTTISWTQYTDQVYQKTISAGGGSGSTPAVGRTLVYGYDAFGNVIYELHSVDYVLNWIGSPTYLSRTIDRSYNGFGQLVWERTLGGGTKEAERFFDYSPTGELKASWEGNKDNQTVYTYGDVPGEYNFARTTHKEIGVSGNRNTQENYIYDVFGRVLERKRMRSGSNSYDILYSYTYDTLDRVATETEPDGTFKGTRYHALGTPDVNCNGDYYTDTVNITTNWYACESHYIDPMGRIGYSYIDAGEGNFYEVTTTYDPKDNPLKITNTSLEMNSPGADQSTYFEYDSFGRLVKQKNPPLRTASGGGYLDSRTPLSLYAYDNLGRKSSESHSVGPDSQHAYTSYSYDGFDRPYKVIGPELMNYEYSISGAHNYFYENSNDSYITHNSYDGSGNLYQQIQQVCHGGNTTCKTYSPGTVTPGLPANDPLNNSPLVTTRYTFDSMGRVTSIHDGRGYITRKAYDLLGNVLAESNPTDNQLGITVKAYQYRADGLLERVAEPTITANPSGNSNVTGIRQFSGTTPPTGYVVTKKYVYDTYSTKPSRVDQQTGSTADVSTYFTYDFMDRLVSTTYSGSGGNDIFQRYDTRGNLMYVEDPDDFVTEYMYNGWNRMTKEVKLPRTSTVDQVASVGLLGNNVALTLTTDYIYDLAGNLVQQNKGSGLDLLKTKYTYNSQGKVISETLPHKSTVPQPKLKFYNQAGWLVGETTHRYNGNLRGTASPSSFTSTNLPTVTSGSVVMTNFNPRGEKVKEVSLGVPPGTSTAITQYTADYSNNGLGHRYKRSFSGSTSIYAVQGSGSADYDSYWKHDANGNLEEAFDLLPSDTVNKRNWFVYQYYGTNKERSHTRTVQVPGGSNVGTATNTYNERDLLQTTTVSDNNSNTTNTTTTSYTYYPDGRKKRSTVGAHYVEVETYDTRGRETQIYDSNGAQQANALPNSPETIKITYGKGTVTREIFKFGTTECRFKSETVTTVGGLTYSSKDWNKYVQGGAVCGSATPTQNSVTQYDTTGQSEKVSSLTFSPTSTGSASTTTNLTIGYGNTGQRSTEIGTQQTVFVVNGTTNSSNTGISNTYLYDDNDAVSRIEVSPGSPSVIYQLDSRGNRLAVALGPNAGGLKRYDADGRTSEFKFPTQPVPNGNSSKDQALYFRYDPEGRQVLALDHTWGHIERPPAAGGAEFDYDNKQFVTTVIVENEAQTLRVQALSTIGGLYVGGALDSGVRDQTFSVADGAVHRQWDITQPFGVRSPNQPLAAPTTPFSIETRVSTGNLGVLDIKPPSAQDTTPPGTTPTTGTGEVKAPEKSGEQPAKSDEQGKNNVAPFGVGSGNLSGLPGLPDLNATETEEADEAATEDFGLKPPSSVLPPTLQSLDTKAVQAPTQQTDTSNPLPGNTGNPNDVKQPDQTPTPGVGTNPNDTPGVIKAPETSGLLPPNIPRIDPTNQQPITTVQAPVGWSPDQEGSINTLTLTIEELDKLLDDYAKSLEALTQKQREEIKLKTGKSPEELLADRAAQAYIYSIYNSYPEDARNNPEIRRTAQEIAYTLEKLPPAEKIAAYRGLAMFVQYAVGNQGVVLQKLTEIRQNESGEDFKSALANAIRDGESARDLANGVKTAVEGLASATKFNVGSGVGRGLNTAAKAAGSGGRLTGLLGRIRGDGRRLSQRAAGCLTGANSFTPDTKVATDTGLMAIGSVTVGTKVLAFNEKTGKNEYQPIMEVFKNQDPELTFLTLKDDETNKEEFTTTTPGHPFYLQKNVDNSQRPAPKGHEDLKQPWVGAGDLKLGDKVRQSDGTSGTVIQVRTVQENRTMYNLDVAVADTFYIGEGQWLVHNANVCDDIINAVNKRLTDRANQMHALLPEGAQGYRTTAVLQAIDENGNIRYIIGSSRNRLDPVQRQALGANEIEATGPGHAEITAINEALELGWKPVRIAASRPICEPCALYLKKYGVEAASPLK